MSDPTDVNEIDGQTLALVPAGKAVFGSREDDPDALDHEKPQFEAELPDFYLGIYCVTNAQYAAFLNAVQPSQHDRSRWIRLWYTYLGTYRPDAGRTKTIWQFENGLGFLWARLEGPVQIDGSNYVVDEPEHYGDHPIVRVSWYGAQAYCEWAGLRLPTELEWEKGARGQEGSRYPWGNEWDANMCRHKRNRGVEMTCRVSDYPEGMSEWGMFNMSGNVWEWCADWYDSAAYERYAGGDLEPPKHGIRRVMRGGSWCSADPKYFRCAHRKHRGPASHPEQPPFGFRCARGL
jgi:formylglycine-generating enzyme required for sulfatase activity